MKAIVIYHAGCQDGFAAAAVCHEHLLGDYSGQTMMGKVIPEIGGYETHNANIGPIYFLPCQYGTKLSDLLTKAGIGDVSEYEIFIVDFSFKPEEINVCLGFAKKIVILDHHKTAENNFKSGIPNTPERYYHFDMTKCGAVLTHEYWKERKGKVAQPIPDMLAYVQDRDLWQWKLADSKAINAYLSTLDRRSIELGVWAKMIYGYHFNQIKFADAGYSVIDAQNILTNQALSHQFPFKLGGYDVIAVNSPVLQSEIGDKITTANPEATAAIFYMDKDGVITWSLRSKNGTARKIAEQLGGGGHDNAAGCRTRALGDIFIQGA